MHPNTKPRQNPFVWVTWITKILAGESQCTWAAWQNAHYTIAKRPSDFDQSSWMVEHSALLRKVAQDETDKGFAVTREDQNKFNLKGSVGTLSGKPDIISIKDKTGWIIDTKTGAAKASDKVQVMLYMWALPYVRKDLGITRYDGKIVYKNNYDIVLADDVTPSFIKNVVELIREVCGSTQLVAVPSFSECSFCPITDEDCDKRSKAIETHEAETDQF